MKLIEQSAKLKGADELPLDYRAGITHQALGNKEAARAAFTRFINKGKGQESSINEAKKRLAQLGT